MAKSTLLPRHHDFSEGTQLVTTEPGLATPLGLPQTPTHSTEDVLPTPKFPSPPRPIRLLSDSLIPGGVFFSSEICWVTMSYLSQGELQGS